MLTVFDAAKEFHGFLRVRDLEDIAGVINRNAKNLNVTVYSPMAENLLTYPRNR
jgi:hypothetical protein